ncbi:hypothetical protein K2173_014088 [Erythroxylum novogranatense]|uniref:Homeobox-leucine zipper protein n=1 Tax=Erythroxylum novogranatense TaxID=1862640 RepID=A0AAV8SDM9_9ROSI|nr:hypothetical protein K2173_014088 [Erythroxylum novogranatense]
MEFPPHGFMFHSHEDHHHHNDHLPSSSFLNSLPSYPPHLFPMHGGDYDLSNDGSQIGKKKKRLNLEQVKELEKSFECFWSATKEIAIRFQNRRVRWKTKQLERDYKVLKKHFDALKADNDALQVQNKKLHSEGRDLNEINLKKEIEGSWSNESDNSCDINLDISRTPVETSPVASHIMSITQGGSRSEIQGLKVDHLVEDDNFYNMFNGIDEQWGL